MRVGSLRGGRAGRGSRWSRRRSSGWSPWAGGVPVGRATAPETASTTTDQQFPGGGGPMDTPPDGGRMGTPPDQGSTTDGTTTDGTTSDPPT